MKRLLPQRIFPHLATLFLLGLVVYLGLKMWWLYQSTIQLKSQQQYVTTQSDIAPSSKHYKWYIQAKIVSLPVYREQYNAFYFSIEPIALIARRGSSKKENQVQSDSGPEALPDGFPKKIRVAWYQNFHSKRDHALDSPPQLGEHWQLWLKLRPIHSRFNVGSFDYEKWAFVQRIDARAYVLNNTKRAPYNNFHMVNYQSDKGLDYALFWISKWRTYLRTEIEKSSITDEAKALLKALMIGDKSSLSETQRDVFRDAGISHLLSISGLHIGLAFLFMGGLWSFLWRRSARLCRCVSAVHIWFFGGVLSAIVYALVAGFEIPVQRALVMLIVSFIALMVKRHIPKVVILLLAFMAVMLFDIRSFYATGFWLSFVSVAIIIFLLRRDDYSEHQYIWSGLSDEKSWLLRGKHIGALFLKKVGVLLKLQLAITVCLIPLLLFFFQTSSVISPLANLTITPLVAMLIIPVMMIAIFLSFIPPVFIFLIENVGVLLHQLNVLLVVIVQWLDIRIQLPSPPWWVAGVSTVGLIVFFMSKHLLRKLGCLALVLILLFPYQKNITEGTARIFVLDVGQGLSVVVFTKGHSLIYDFGNRGVGRSIIYPFMNAHLREADTLLTSHHDIDHYGGADYIFAQYPKAKQIDWRNCTGQWKWDKVLFELWQYPFWEGSTFRNSHIKTKHKTKDNNTSCMLKITSANGQSMLITADIEKEVEHWLIDNKKERLTSNILLVPHHGSKSSSSREFLQAINPDVAMISAGFHNRFRHPHTSVIQRYKELSVPVLNTMCGGMLSVELGKENEKSNEINKNNRVNFDATLIRQYRKDKAYFWLNQCGDL